MDCLILTLDLAEIDYYIENYVVYIILREENLELEDSIQQLINNSNLCSQKIKTSYGTDLLCIYEPIKYDFQNRPIKGYLETQEKRNTFDYGYYYDDFDDYYDDYELFEYCADYLEVKFHNEYLDKPYKQKIKKKGI